MYTDLHIHSWYSDGTYSPEEIINKARSQNVTTISICDHNMIDAYTKTKELCGVKDIKIIPGVEITSVFDDKEFHILAYNFDMGNKALNDLLQYNRNIYHEMGNILIGNIAKDYPQLSITEYANYERNRKNGGWDSIDYLRSKGLVTDWESYIEIASKYGSPPDNDFMPPEEVIKIVHDAGGIAVLAHLCHHVMADIADWERNALQFLHMGIDGFECYYPACSTEITKFLVGFCHEHGLLITAGSDDHGGFIGAPGEEYYIGAVRVGEIKSPLLIYNYKRSCQAK